MYLVERNEQFPIKSHFDFSTKSISGFYLLVIYKINWVITPLDRLQYKQSFTFSFLTFTYTLYRDNWH